MNIITMTKGFLNNDRTILTQLYKHIENKQKQWDRAYKYTHEILYFTMFVIFSLVLLCILYFYNPPYAIPIIGLIFAWGYIRDKSEKKETDYSPILSKLKRKIKSLE